MELYSKLSDADLLLLVKSGDEAAFTEIYNRYWAILYRHARRMLHDDDEAEDIIQETFILFLNKAPYLELKSTLSGYLYTTVRNRIFNHIEHDKVKDKYISSIEKFIDKADYQTDYLIREKQLSVLIEQEIAALPEMMRSVFELSRNSNLSYKEIAEQLDVSESVVRNNVSRALKILRTKFGTIALLYLFLNN
jgi:RNA polymerase sigma-70 factor (ECF subfamily)